MHTWLIYVHICCIHAPYRFFPYGSSLVVLVTAAAAAVVLAVAVVFVVWTEWMLSLREMLLFSWKNARMSSPSMCALCRDVSVCVQCVLLRHYNQNQSSSRRMSSQHCLCAASTFHVLTDRRLGLEHHLGNGLRTARLSVLPIYINHFCAVVSSNECSL